MWFHALTGALYFDNPGDHFYHPLRLVGSFAVAFERSTFVELLDGIKRLEGAFDAFPMQAVVLPNVNDSYALYPNLIIADVTASDTQSGRFGFCL